MYLRSGHQSPSLRFAKQLSQSDMEGTLTIGTSTNGKPGTWKDVDARDLMS